jgi:hypothetical protein
MYSLCSLNGFENILDGGGAILNSAGNPLKEARCKLERLQPGPGSVLVAFGAGAGYLIESAYRDFGVKTFIIFEPDQEISSVSLQREELANVINDASCAAYFFDRSNFNEGLIEDIILQNVDKKFVATESGYFIKGTPEFFYKVRKFFLEKYAACLEAARRCSLEGYYHKNPNSVYSAIAGRAVFDGPQEEDMP